MPPLISIITPALNTGATLAETLESVVAEDFSDIEHWLIDAKSSDETLAIASKYPYLKVISEHDRGIYDGMNKGAGMASGEWLLFLQADDWLPEGALKAYRNAIKQNPTALMICGGAEAVRMSDGGWKTIWSVTDLQNKKLTLENIALGEPMINARLIRRDVFLQLGFFSLDYTLASDRDFLIQAALLEIKQIEISELTYRYRWHSGSSTMTEGNQLTQKLSSENLAVAKKYLSLGEEAQRAVFRKWHTNLMVQAAMNDLESFKLKNLLQSAVDGFQVDRLWPLYFAAEITRSLPGFLARGGKTRSQILAGVKSE